MRAIALICLLAATVAAAAVPPAGPSAATTAFYRDHFARRDLMALSREGVDRSRSYLTERLRGLLARELDRYDEEAAKHGGPSAFKPFVAGDVFTGSETLPDDFRAEHATVSEGRVARVPVTFTWTTPPEGDDAAKSVTVVLKKDTGRWLVDDVIYPDGGSLVDLLSRPEYDSYGT